MLSLAESYNAMENLFGIELIGNEGFPYEADLFNEPAPAKGTMVMYYGDLYCLGDNTSESNPAPTTGTAKLFIGTVAEGAVVYNKEVVINDTTPGVVCRFNSFELVNCRAFFSGYKYVKVIQPTD